MRRLHLSCAASLVAVAGIAFASAARGATQEASPPAAAFDVSDCKACHEKAVEHMATTPHAGVAAELRGVPRRRHRRT